MNISKLPLALTYSDVLLKPQYSEVTSRKDVSLKTKITPKISIKIPIISINMDTVTGPKMAEGMYKAGAISFYPRFKEPAEQAKEIKSLLKRKIKVLPAIGIKPTESKRADLLVKAGAKAITIDVAHGHLKTCLDMVKMLKEKYPKVEIIAGVIGTYRGARDLFEAGADAVRVGVGPGTICTTRKQTGSGMPQITAISEAARAAKEYENKFIIADGGTKSSGDIVKALAAGANAVAVGSQLAGAKEAPGDVIEIDGVRYKEYNGSTSLKEKQRQMKKYKKDKSKSYLNHIEGTEARVRCTGSISEILERLSAGIRSGLSYSGAFNIDELHEKARFMRVTPVSARENGAHGVDV